MSDMMLEVDEALRAQQLKAFWDKFGQWIIGLVVLTVLGTAAGVLWHNHKNTVLGQQTNEVLNVLQNEGEPAATAKELEKLAAASDMPLKSVTQLYQAQKLEQAKDLKGAQKVYNAIAADSSVSVIVRHLATIHDVRLGLVNNDASADLLKKISPVADKEGSFKASAMELKGLVLLQDGKTSEANAIFNTLADDKTAPSGLRLRAKNMVRYEVPNDKK